MKFKKITAWHDLDQKIEKEIESWLHLKELKNNIKIIDIKYSACNSKDCVLIMYNIKSK